jgi:hypothetical protein
VSMHERRQMKRAQYHHTRRIYRLKHNARVS